MKHVGLLNCRIVKVISSGDVLQICLRSEFFSALLDSRMMSQKDYKFLMQFLFSKAVYYFHFLLWEIEEQGSLHELSSWGWTWWWWKRNTTISWWMVLCCIQYVNFLKLFFHFLVHTFLLSGVSMSASMETFFIYDIFQIALS